MTTNNHPERGPVSLDRLHQISEILSKAAAQSDGGNLGYAMADAVKVIDGAIAAFGAQPVSNSDEFPLDYLQGHKDGLEWAAQLAEANHPQTGDWLYDDPIELARAIRKGPDMPKFKSVSVDEDDNFYSWFGRFWYENYQKNNYTTSAKQMLGTMAEFAYRAGRESAALAGNSPVAPDGWVMVPKKLTAENGAKAALLGEFNIEYTLTCHECFGEGCDDCSGEGAWINTIQVDWTTIKDIWAKGVEHFAAGGVKGRPQ